MSSLILISGSGQLGSRYLQGMARCDLPLKIFVHDLSIKSLEIAKQRWEEVLTKNTLTMKKVHGVKFTSIALSRDTVCVNLFSNTQCSYLQTIIDALIGSIEQTFEQEKSIFERGKSTLMDQIILIKQDIKFNKKQHKKQDI